MTHIVRYDIPENPWIRKRKTIKLTDQIDRKIKTLKEVESFYRGNNKLSENDIIHEAIEFYWMHPGIQEHVQDFLKPLDLPDIITGGDMQEKRQKDSLSKKISKIEKDRIRKQEAKARMQRALEHQTAHVKLPATPPPAIMPSPELDSPVDGAKKPISSDAYDELNKLIGSDPDSTEKSSQSKPSEEEDDPENDYDMDIPDDVDLPPLHFSK